MNIGRLLSMAYRKLAAMTLVEWLGWSGVAMIYGAYVLNVNMIITAGSGWYLGANILGSMLYGYELITKRVGSGIALQGAWIAGTLPSLLRLL